MDFAFFQGWAARRFFLQFLLHFQLSAIPAHLTRQGSVFTCHTSTPTARGRLLLFIIQSWVHCVWAVSRFSWSSHQATVLGRPVCLGCELSWNSYLYLHHSQTFPQICDRSKAGECFLPFPHNSRCLLSVNRCRILGQWTFLLPPPQADNWCFHPFLQT